MAKKAEERLRRKLERLAKANHGCDVASSEKLPRIIATTSNSIGPKVAPHIARELAKANKTPRANEPKSRFADRVSWCVTRSDRKGEWGWGEVRDWTNEEWETLIQPKLLELQQLTWGEVDRFSSDTGHKMHHSHEIGDIHSEAQDRWCAIGLEEYDTLFRFRFGGQKKRAWGFIVGSHFHLVWWDRQHMIYETDPHG